MTATDSYAYWASDTVIRRVAVSDNSETVLVDHTASPNSFQSLAIDGDTLYFSEVGFRDSLAVAKMPADGSGAPVKLADANSPWQIAVADGYVYYYDAGPNEIARVPVTGGTPTVLVRGVNPAGLTIANGYVYFVHPRTNNDVSNLLRVPVDAKAPDPDAGIDAGDGLVPLGAEIVAPTDNYHPDGPTSDANNLYYDDKLKVMRVSIAGGTPTMIAEATYEVGKIVPYGGKVYWSTEGCGDIVRSSIDGIERTTIVHFAAADRLAVNATHVYFIGFMRQLIRAPH